MRVLPHLLEREEALVLDGLHDGSLAHAVAAADLGGIGERQRPVLALVARVAQVGFAEHEPVADGRDAGAFAQQPEVPGPVHGVAVEHGTGELVVPDDELLVDARAGVGEHDVLRALAAREVAGGEEVHARHLELGRGDGPGVAGDAVLGEVVGAHLRHLEEGGHQPVGRAAVAGALAHGIDARIVGLEGVVHHDAALAVEPRRFGERGVGPDPDRHHDEVGRQLLARLQAQRAHAAAGAFQQRLGLRLQPEGEPLGLERLLQHAGRRAVELALHEPGHQVHHGDGHAALGEAVGRLEAEEPAAHDDRVPVVRRRGDHGLGVADVAVGKDAFELRAGHGQHEGVDPVASRSRS